MSEPLPCPFCGNTPGDDSYTLTDGGFKYGAISCGCGAVGPDVRTLYKQWPEWKDAAVAEWNERAIPADQVLVPRELLGDLGVLLDSLELFSTKLPSNAAEMIESARKKITTLLHP